MKTKQKEEPIIKRLMESYLKDLPTILMVNALNKPLNKAMKSSLILREREITTKEMILNFKEQFL